jgi:hypothetical protein
MRNLASTTLRTFVPAKSFETARRFYKDLGFTEKWSSDTLACIECGSESFLLQNAYQEVWANNFMMQLMVQDLDAWWDHLQKSEVATRYEGVKMKAPEDYPWGLREIHLIDPSGVLWHITQIPQ